jgi:hypothetical protein
VKRREPGGPTPRSGLCSATLGTVTPLAAVGLTCSGLGVFLALLGTVITWRRWDLGTDPDNRLDRWLRRLLVALHLLPGRPTGVIVQAGAALVGVGAVDARGQRGLTGIPVEDVLLLEERLNLTRADLAALDAQTQQADAALRDDLGRLEAALHDLRHTLDATSKRVATDGLGLQLVGSLLVLVGVVLTALGSV